MRYLIFTAMEYVAAGDKPTCIAMTDSADMMDIFLENNDYVIYDSLEDKWLDLQGSCSSPPNQQYYTALDMHLSGRPDLCFDGITLDIIQDWEWDEVSNIENIIDFSDDEGEEE